MILIILFLLFISCVVSYLYYAGFLLGKPKIYRDALSKIKAYENGEMTRDEFKQYRSWTCLPENKYKLKGWDETLEGKIAIFLQGKLQFVPKKPDGTIDDELRGCNTTTQAN